MTIAVQCLHMVAMVCLLMALHYQQKSIRALQEQIDILRQRLELHTGTACPGCGAREKEKHDL